MKKSLILMPLLLLFGCKKIEQQIDQILTFNVTVTQVSRVPLPTHVSTALPAPVTVITNSAAAFNSNNTNSAKVKEVYLDQMQLTLIDHLDDGFDFVDTLRVYINTPGVNNRVLLASIINHPPNGATTLTLDPTKARLDEYLKSDKYQLSVYSHEWNQFNFPNSTPNDSLTIRTNARFRVTANHN